MKKVLSILSIMAIFGLMAPAFAAPEGHGRPGGHHGGPPSHGAHHRIHAGYNHHRPHVVHHSRPHHVYHGHHGGHIHVGGVLARRSYWGYPYGCDYRLSWCDDYYHPRPYYGGSGVYLNFGIPIRF